MPLEKQFSVFVQNKVGSLSKLCSQLSQKGINIRALSLVDDLEWGIVRLIVDDNKKTKSVLEGLGFKYGETRVLVVEIDNHPGALAEMADQLAREDINIDQAYTTAKGKSAVVVLATTDDKKASKLV